MPRPTSTTTAAVASRAPAPLLLSEVRVEDARTPRDLLVVNGRIAPPGTPVPAAAARIDCGGRVVLPGFVEPHLHLDKALLDGLRPNPDGTLAGAISVTGALKAGFTRTGVRDRARRVLDSAILNGTTLIRAHPDVDPIAGLLGVEVLLELREEYADAVGLQIVAFPQEGVLRSPGTRELLRDALDAGADVIGGCPYNEDTVAQSRSQIELVLDLAVEFGVPADLHADFGGRRAGSPVRAGGVRRRADGPQESRRPGRARACDLARRASPPASGTG